MLLALNEISTCQYAPNKDKMDKWNQFLYYASTHPNTTIRYHMKNMILMTETDAAYPILPESCRHIAGYYYFTNRMIDYSKGNPAPNSPISIEWKTLKTVVSSSSEAEIGGNFEDAQNVIPLRHILETIYLHQQPTKFPPITT